MITGVILARNEEANIVECLQAFRPLVAEMLLIDMESSDRTVELAQPFVNKVLKHPIVPQFDAARNIAIGEAHHDWLWFVDADERVPFQTGQVIQSLIRERGEEFSAITIPFKNYFCGRWIQHCGWWPGYTMPRVLKKGCFRFSEKLHGGVDFQGKEFRIPPDPQLAVDHFSYHSVEHYLEKFNRYTSVEAGQLAEKGDSSNWQVAMAAMMRDLWAYFEAGEGRRGGHHAWVLSWLAGQYRWFSHTKLMDVRPEQADQGGGPPDLDAVLHLMEDELAKLRRDRPQLPLGLVWRSPVWDASGYAEDSRVFLKALSAGERPFSAKEIRWSDEAKEFPPLETGLFRALLNSRRPSFTACITSCIPTVARPDPAATLNILRTTFETDRIPENWLDKFDLYDEVWVFSEHDRTAFRRGGAAPEKIRVLGGFIDTDVYTPRGPKLRLPRKLSGRFVFLSVFDWQFRKGWDVLLKAYCKQFSADDGAALLLKLTRIHGHSLEAIQQDIERILSTLGQSLEQRPDIVIWDKSLPSQEMPALYRAVDCFVLPSRGEGWGRPYMEAMACGVPTIGSAGSGNADFMNEDNSCLISTTLTPVPEHAAQEIQVFRGHQWLEPDEDELQQTMQNVFEDQSLRKKLGQQAAKSIRENFSLRQAQQAVEQNLRAAEARFEAAPAGLGSADCPEDAAAIRLAWEGEFFAGHSFSNVNEQLALQFRQRPYVAPALHRVENWPSEERLPLHGPMLRPYFGRTFEQGPEVTVRHAFPPNWSPPEQGKWVHIQHWEFGSLPIDWVAPLRDKVDEIWAATQYVKQVYVRSGVAEEKVRVIPLGIDPQNFSPKAPPVILPSDGKFVFLFIGGTIHRKGFDTLWQAFLEEFSPHEDVLLVVKDMGTRSFYRADNHYDVIVSAINSGQAPHVAYLDREMTPGQLASLYTACDCLVTPYRGEGFGLPILEAMACGLAVIVPSGKHPESEPEVVCPSDDFVNEEDGWLLPMKVVECHHGWRLCGPAQEFSVTVEDVRHAMRQAFEHPKETKQKGLRASHRVRGEFSWENTAQKIEKRLYALCRAEPLPKTDGKDQKQSPAHTSLTLCVLFKNDEQLLAETLGRVRPLAEELLAVDLGSSDRSADVCREYGAKILPFAFADNYAAAWNHALLRCTKEWILCLWPGELLSEEHALEMFHHLEQLPSQVLGLAVRVRSQVNGRANGRLALGAELFDSHQVRCFRNRNHVLYEQRVAQDVAASIVRLGGRIAPSEAVIYQTSSAAGESSVRSNGGANLVSLLHLDMAERPGDPMPLLQLGRAHFTHGDYFHAECFLQDCMERCGAGEPIWREAARLLVAAHHRAGHGLWAQQTGLAALNQVPDDPVLPQLLEHIRHETLPGSGPKTP